MGQQSNSKSVIPGTETSQEASRVRRPSNDGQTNLGIGIWNRDGAKDEEEFRRNRDAHRVNVSEQRREQQARFEERKRCESDVVVGAGHFSAPNHDDAVPALWDQSARLDHRVCNRTPGWELPSDLSSRRRRPSKEHAHGDGLRGRESGTHDTRRRHSAPDALGVQFRRVSDPLSEFTRQVSDPAPTSIQTSSAYNSQRRADPQSQFSRQVSDPAYTSIRTSPAYNSQRRASTDSGMSSQVGPLLDLGALARQRRSHQRQLRQDSRGGAGLLDDDPDAANDSDDISLTSASALAGVVSEPPSPAPTDRTNRTMTSSAARACLSAQMAREEVQTRTSRLRGVSPGDWSPEPDVIYEF